MPRRSGSFIAEHDLQHYLRQINEVALLTGDEEKELARKIQAASGAAERFGEGKLTLAERERIEEEGNQARERLVRANLRLVVSISKQYRRRQMPLADLIEEGNLGLLRAVEGFDPDQGVRFSTYAAWWIKQSIKRALINAVQPVHIPAYMVELVTRWKDAQKRLLEQHGRTPTLQEMAEFLELPERKVRIIRRAVKAVSSGSQSGDADSHESLAEQVHCPRTLPPHEVLTAEQEQRMIQRILEDDVLSDREVTILRLRYGMDGQEPLTLREIGQKIGLTKERVRQLEGEALEKLERLMNGESVE